jgi:hypothetical protein
MLNHSKKKIKPRLPNKILALPNPDKEFHERWTPRRNSLNIPHPWRGVFLGPPNCGKGTVLKNLLLRAKPQFEEVFVIHCDPDYTQEWDDIGAEILSQIPAPDEWEGQVKTLVILDDLDYKSMDKIQMKNLSRLYGFCSTHKHISVALLQQDAFSVPAIVRRCSNLFVFWRCPDIDAMSCVARKTGMKANNFNAIFNQLNMRGHDSLWIDLTSKTPYPKRKNGYTIIKKIEDGDETKKELEKQDTFTEE